MEDRTTEAEYRRAAPFVGLLDDLDPGRLPARFDLDPGAPFRLGIRVLYGAAVGLALLIGTGVALTWEEREAAEVAFALALPAVVAGLGAWAHLRHRDVPRRFVLDLTEARVLVETLAERWSLPVSSYAGLALRSWQVSKAAPLGHPSRHGRTALERGMRIGEDVTVWWVELVHPDPSRVVVLWAGSEVAAASDGLDRAERFARRFGLPLLTTSGVRRIDDPDAEEC
ncbi:MAG TPA: hypothetical protein VN324_15390 [Quisquiliibacterium sp.]|nr:hypothetical protein [Quisquiliibacterium sp.]